MNNKLTVKKPESAVAPASAISLESAFQAIMTKELDGEKLSLIKQLLAMNAEQKFNVAFSGLQSEIPVIVAESAIPNRGKYQRYEDILQKDGVAKLLTKYGFSVGYEQEYKCNVITVTCILRHNAGHQTRTPFSVRVGGKADSETQADCKASTTAKRNAFCQALNITIRQDVLMDEENDASIIGNPSEFITLFQSDELERRVQETNSNVQAFLKFAGATKFSEILASKYDELDASLKRKESLGK